jgi:hypothetical protein
MEREAYMLRSGSKTRSILQRAAAGGLMALVLSTGGLLPAVHAASDPLRSAKLADLRGEQASLDVRHIADWAVHSGDHGGLPFAVIDKREGRVYVFDPAGRLRGAAPALVGAARGDESVPGIGERQLSTIRPEERTTPAGRFKAVMGRGGKNEDLLWVDYEAAVALHRVVTNVPQERRLERLRSTVPGDRRITYGCINVPVDFYDTVVRPTFSSSGGIVYVLPELRRPEELFGSYDVRSPLGQATAAHRVQTQAH